MKPILLDLYCGAGGAGYGYAQAGFEVIGVDNAQQPNYPFAFAQMDVLIFLRALLDGVKSEFSNGKLYGLDDIDAIHASPPCQGYSRILALVEAIYGKKYYPDLIATTRDLLVMTGKPYVIENVRGAPLRADFLLNGLMFGLRLLRERWFETNWFSEFLKPPLPKKPRRWTTNVHRGMSSFAKGAALISMCGRSFSAADAKQVTGFH